MKIRTTLEAVRAAYEPAINALPYNKPRDPFEREILKRLGDPNVAQETQGLTRIAGERFTPSNSRVTK